MNKEDFYKEVAYHCWVSNFKVGEAYEGMRHDFDNLWFEKKTYVAEEYKKIIDSL